jgi:hypothetical protein
MTNLHNTTFVPGSNFNNKYFSEVPGKIINAFVCAIHRSILETFLN